MKLLIPEILQKANEAKTRQEKIDILRKNDSQPLRAMLYLAHVDVKWHLPEGNPPFKREEKTPIGLSETNLYREARRLYIWVGDNPQQNLSKFKREQLFIEMLEGIHYTEADLLLELKDKKFAKKYKTLKADVVREAFPGLLPAEDPKPVPLEQK